MPGTIAAWHRAAAAVLMAVFTPAIAEPYAVGDGTLQLPGPAALVRVSDSLPELVETFQGYAPEQARVLEAYVTPEDHATFVAGEGGTLARYAQLAVMRVSETKPMSAVGFRANPTAMERALEATVPGMSERLRAQTEKGNAQVKAQYGVDVESSVSDVGYHGVYRRENWGLFFTAALDVKATGTADVRLYTASALALIDTRFLSFTVYADDTGPGRLWARNTLNAWVDAAHQANPGDLAREVSSIVGSSASGQRVLLSFAGLLIVGGIAGVTVLVSRRRAR